MYRRLRVFATMLALPTLAGPAAAQTLMSGGDGISSYVASYVNNGTATFDQIQFDNFRVADGFQWNVTGLFGTFFAGRNFATLPHLNWEIRQGMVATGSTGVSVASGRDSYSANGSVLSLAVTPLVLGAGDYWLGIWADFAEVTPTNQDMMFFGVSTTLGTNRINALNDRQAVRLINGTGVGALTLDYTYGVLGTAQQVAVVPEPSSAVLLVAGMIVLVAIGHRRRTVA